MKATASLLTVGLGLVIAAWLLVSSAPVRRLPVDAISAIKADDLSLDGNTSYAFAGNTSSGDFSASIVRSSSPPPSTSAAAAQPSQTSNQSLQVSSAQDNSTSTDGQSISSSSHQTIIQNDSSVSSSVSTSVSNSNGSSTNSVSHGYSAGLTTQNGQIVQQYFNNY